MSNGTNLLTSWEEVEEEWGDGHRIVRFTLNGDPHAAAICDAVADHYNALAARPRPTRDDLELLIGEKVTLIQVGGNMMGAGVIAEQEGKLFHGSGDTLGILPKGARSKGYRVDPDKVLDVLPGYSAADAAEMVRRVRDHFPKLKPLTQERLNGLPSNSETLSLCVFGSYRMPDSTATDALYLLSEYMREDDIVEGVLLIREEHGFSEHGSVWGRTLVGGRFGEVVGFEPISFAEGIHLCNLEFEEAYGQVIGPLVAA